MKLYLVILKYNFNTNNTSYKFLFFCDENQNTWYEIRNLEKKVYIMHCNL